MILITKKFTFYTSYVHQEPAFKANPIRSRAVARQSHRSRFEFRYLEVEIQSAEDAIGLQIRV